HRIMSLRIIYKVRTVPTEGGHPERPEPSKPGRGHKYATPVSRRTIRAAQGQRHIIPDARRSGLASFWHGERFPRRVARQPRWLGDRRFPMFQDGPGLAEGLRHMREA